MQLDHWLSLVGICLLGAMSPGPSLAVVMNTALRRGHRAGYGAAIAHGLGVGLYALLTVAGLAVLVTRSPALFLVIQVLGAAYLIYLGVQSLRHAAAQGPGGDKIPTREHSAMDGFWIAFLNPKLAVFMLALFSQFIKPEAGLLEKSVMVATVAITDACWYALVVTLLSRTSLQSKLLHHGPLIDRVFGVLIILLAVSVLLRALLGS